MASVQTSAPASTAVRTAVSLSLLGIRLHFAVCDPQGNLEPFKMKLWLIAAITLSFGVQVGT